MTKTEIERLAVVETKVDDLKDSIDGLRTDLCDFIKTADQRYASKLVEKLVYGLVGTVLLAVLYAILNFIGLHT